MVLGISIFGSSLIYGESDSERVAAIQDLIAAGRLAEAQPAISQALASEPKNAGLWNLKGIVEAQKGNGAGAEEAFRQAVGLAPRLTSAWLNLGRLYQLGSARKDAIEKGLAAYQTVLQLDPQNAEAHHQTALLLEWKGEFRESLAHLNQLPLADQARRPALALRCADEAGLGNAAASLKAAEQMLKDPDLEEADLTSILPVVARNEQVTLRLLEGMESRGLATVETRSALATLYEKRSDLGAARKQLELVAKTGPAQVNTLLELARISWKQKDFEGTLGYLAHARDLDANNPGIHFFFGVTCNELHLPIEARKALEKALEIAPDNPYYNYAMGAIRLQWKETDGAIPFLEKYVKARPEDSRGRLALALAYFSIDRYDQAKQELGLLRDKSQTRSGAEYLLGRIAEQSGDLKAAIGHFERLVKLEPNWPEAHAALGGLFLGQNDAAAAHRETSAALALDRDNYTANRTLMRLYRLNSDPRLEQQTARLKTLVDEKDEKLKLLQRTIEVRPW